jgi:formylglycine-generating enzyme required for sulfatase activity
MTKFFQKLLTDLSGILGKSAHKNSVANDTLAESSNLDDSKKNIAREAGNLTNDDSLTKDPQVRNHAFLEPELIQITGGQLLMGSPKSEKGRDDNEQQHEVLIDDFAIGRFPVTFAEYDMYCDEVGLAKPDDKSWGRSNRPVINVSWMDAQNYTQWLARVTSKPYRLPTEAEWEFATRGGAHTAYWWGEKFEQDRRNCNGSHKNTTPVDKFKPNPFGLYDMVGNVWEWTGSCYEQDYNGLENSSAEKEDYNRRVIRGGSWHYQSAYTRSANRYGFDPDDGSFDLGFRLVQD